MGYRSMIYCKVAESLTKEFDQILKDKDMTTYFTPIDNQDCPGYVKYEGEDLKWYDGYPDVDAVNEFINEHDDTCAMIVVGEDNTTESWGQPWDLDMYTYVEVEW